jgi:predicted RNase H-like nuclease
VNIISCDVGWRSETKRNAIAVVTDRRKISFLKSGLDDDRLVSLVCKWAETQSLILLDVPIKGCEKLEGPRRPIENALQHYISLYPASRAGNRGKQLHDELFQKIRVKSKGNIIIKEIYPHAIYKFLWAVERKGKLAEVRRQREQQNILDNQFIPSISPPKYKGSKVEHDKRIIGMWELYNLLTQRLDLDFSQPLEPPDDSFSATRLEVLADQYDACLGAVVGLYCVTGNSYSWIAGDERQGEMLLLADIWLKKQLEEYGISIKRLSLNLSSA